MNNKGSLFKGILLVAGTSIGGGMLALPVLTSLTGFFPSLAIYLLCWLFMASTGLLLLEACTWMKAESNLVTMSQRTLGNWGKWSAWLLYLFLFYCLTVAYIVGCGELVAEVLQKIIPNWFGSLLFAILVFPLLFVGPHFISRLNVILMLGLAISYLTFVFLGLPHVKTELLLRQDWSYSLLALPIAFTSFAYQGIIPTLVTYMHRDIPKIKKAILIGSFLPFFVYTIWQALILGIIPLNEPNGLVEALNNGETAVQPLKYYLNNPFIYVIAQFFAFFALITSFFGVTLGLIDFLSDGLNIKKDIKGKIWLCLLVLIPPLLIAFTYPGIFLAALDYAGGFGCALLLGLMPILMVWSGRYYLNFPKTNIFPFGKVVLALLILFVIFEVITQIVMMVIEPFV